MQDEIYAYTLSVDELARMHIRPHFIGELVGSIHYGSDAFALYLKFTYQNLNNLNPFLCIR